MGKSDRWDFVMRRAPHIRRSRLSWRKAAVAPDGDPSTTPPGATQSQLPARQKKHPSPGSAETFREYLRQRWDAGYRNGRLLLDELRALGYQGTYKAVGKIVSPWRQGNVDFERTANDVTIPAPPPPVLTDPTQRQISPHIAATLLTIPRPDLTAGNAQIVDALKVGCPGYAVMRSLMMGCSALTVPPPGTGTARQSPRTVNRTWLGAYGRHDGPLVSLGEESTAESLLASGLDLERRVELRHQGEGLFRSSRADSSYNGPSSRTALVGLPQANIVRNVPNSDSRYWTWDITANRRFSGRWSLVAGFAHTWNRDQANAYLGQAVRQNAYPLTPNDLINAGNDGWYEFTTWSAKIYGTYQGPWDLRVTPYLRHQSGQPFGRTFSTTLNYGRNIRILAEPMDTRRMDNITILDLRVEKGFRLPGGRRVAGFVDAFNLLNANPEETATWISGPSFLRPLNIIAPRIVRIGTKLEW